MDGDETPAPTEASPALAAQTPISNLQSPTSIPSSSSDWLWQRYEGNPIITPRLVIPPDFAIYNYVGSDPSVMYDEAEGKYKLWFNVGGADNFLDPSSGRVRIGYAESYPDLAVECGRQQRDREYQESTTPRLKAGT